jgi:CRP-like cAMP-binding protein
LNELRENDWFGENSLLGSTRCTATVNATNKVMLLKLNAVDFKRFLSIAPELEEVLRERISVRTADRLKKIPFFTAVRENKPWSKLVHYTSFTRTFAIRAHS